MAERLVIASVARAEDGAYLAMADVAEATAATGTDYRLIGGHMVTAHTARHDLPDLPLRQTADADLGLQAQVLAVSRLIDALTDRGYQLSGGNRLLREAHGLELAIDVLVPADTSRIRHNRPVGDLFVDEAPGLGYALAREPFVAHMEVRLTTGDVLQMTANFPDAVAALCLKVEAFSSRHENRDAVDVWRLLEALNADGMTANDWPRTPTPDRTAVIMRRDFLPINGPGASAASSTPRQHARIRALVSRVVGLHEQDRPH